LALIKTYATDNLPAILQTFIADYSKVYRSALIFAVNHRLSGFADKSKLNTLILQTFQVNKRQAGGFDTLSTKVTEILSETDPTGSISSISAFQALP